MWDFIITIGSVIVVLVAIELLALPDWLNRKLRGGLSNRDIEEKIRSLESRLEEVEREQSAKN